MEPMTRKIMAVCVAAVSVALWFCTIAAYTGIEKAAAQGISQSPTPDEIRDLAEEIEEAAKTWRQDRTYYSLGGALFMPFPMGKGVGSMTTEQEISKATDREMQHIRIYAPAEMDWAMNTAIAVIKAMRHQADTYEALAKKLRQEADRLEREQQKKN